MPEQFEDQGGVSTMDPSAFRRTAGSFMMRRWSDPRRLAARRRRIERARRRSGERHVVEYFHQVDDGYSHLAAQCLRPLLDTYDIDLVCHLVGDPAGQNAPEPELLLDLSCYDSKMIAPHYGLSLPEGARRPDEEPADLAARILAGLDPEDFVDVAPLVGEALWSGSGEALRELAERHAPADPSTLAQRRQAGSDRRTELGHYSGAMFHYGGEWYWGVDRLYHLEERLSELGARKSRGEPVAPRPAIVTGPRKDDGSLTLEIYPSLRSPYSSLIFDTAVSLARETGVTMSMHPVLPMVMRGVPATREKGLYIFTDAAREARHLGLDDWGNVHDPIGEPVRRGYSLYPWAVSRGKGVELLSAFFRAAFWEGVNTGKDRGLRRVVERAGLPWDEARGIVGNSEWEEEVEANRQAMYGFGLWGVPSFRLLDGAGETLLAVWGQDRLWLVGREIQRHLEEREKGL
ncbi:MAG: 2-hydroxychromene-2-carboxylate isomerase [Gammaproteobacteria bacterium]|nr:2-hydroxychromene-2-carboxylate isomerase [Gammaproteobacteria bacterium]